MAKITEKGAFSDPQRMSYQRQGGFAIERYRETNNDLNAWKNSIQMVSITKSK